MKNTKNLFDKWNSLKKNLNNKQKSIHIRQGYICFVSIGKNIVYESYGKDDLFLRPVLVYKKLSKETFLGTPLTSKEKTGNFYFKFNYKKGIDSFAVLNQIRVFDIKRVQYKSGNINKRDYERIEKQLIDFIKVTPKKNGGGITPKMEQRNNARILHKNI